MMSLSYLKFTAALCIVAVCTCLVGSAEGGKPTYLNKPQKEIPNPIRHKRMAENFTTSAIDKMAPPDKEKICYRGETCCFPCSYDSSHEVVDFDLIKSPDAKNTTDIFVCDGRPCPQSDNSTYRFDVEQQELCLMGFVNHSGRYVCKMEYVDFYLPSTLTVTNLEMRDKLGTPTVTVENTGHVKEGERANISCSLGMHNKDPASISVTWYNGTKILEPESLKKPPKPSGNHVTFWMQYTVTRFDNRKEISCQVTDGDQTKTSAKVTLDVQYYPRLECNATAQLVVGRPAKIICKISANPEVPPNSIVFPDELFDTGWVQNGRTLSTSELQPPCNRTLTITANNNVGMGEASLLMDCWFEASIIPKFNRSGNIFSCKAEGNPVPEISWNLLYENNTMKSYNSTASTLKLLEKDLQGVTAVICRADQRQPLHIQPIFHVFNLKQNSSSSSGQGASKDTAPGPVIVALLMGCILGYFLRHVRVWNCLKECLSRQ